MTILKNKSGRTTQKHKVFWWPIAVWYITPNSVTQITTVISFSLIRLGVDWAQVGGSWGSTWCYSQVAAGAAMSKCTCAGKSRIAETGTMWLLGIPKCSLQHSGFRVAVLVPVAQDSQGQCHSGSPPIE